MRSKRPKLNQYFAGLTLACLGITPVLGDSADDFPGTDLLLSERYPERIAGRDRIIEWCGENPEIAQSHVLDLYLEEQNPETRHHLRWILRDLYREKPRAFLGVRFMYGTVPTKGGRKAAIRVTSLVDSGGAAKGGVKQGDHILAIGDFRIRHGMGTRAIMEGIQSLTVGEEVVVELIRGEETLKQTVVMTEHPEGIKRSPAELERSFSSWLKKQFDQRSKP